MGGGARGGVTCNRSWKNLRENQVSVVLTISDGKVELV